MKLKISFFVLLSLPLLFACSENKESNDGLIDTDVVHNPVTANEEVELTSELPKFKFEKEEHDFGVIIMGEKVSYTFKYRNVGKKDLVISYAKGSCGCTVPKYSKEPLKPGEEGYIEVIFDSSGRRGMQSKTITLRANTQPNTKKLKITGEVVSTK